MVRLSNVPVSCGDARALPPQKGSPILGCPCKEVATFRVYTLHRDYCQATTQGTSGMKWVQKGIKAARPKPKVEVARV